MKPALKLLAGLAATVVLTRGVTLLQGQALMAELGNAAAAAMRAEGVADGSVSFRQPWGPVARIARLSGSADAATRAAVVSRTRQHPGIADAVWVDR